MTRISAARAVLKELYGVDAKLNTLYGEFDDNFLAVDLSGEKRILKIMHAECQEQHVDMQCQALAHLARTAAELNLPAVVPTISGLPYAFAPIDGVDRLVWLLIYCEGKLLAEVSEISDRLLRSFGRTMGLLDAGLRRFTHPAIRSGHEWELTRAGQARHYVRHVAADAAKLVDKVLRRFERDTLPVLPDLPHSVIHNDANDGNVLVSIAGDAVVDGLIDFGDIAYQPTICEVAVALAYVVVKRRDPLPACARFLEGYSEINPPSGNELAVLLDLIKVRLAVSISISAERLSRNAEDPVGRQDKRPSVRALARLDAVSPRLAESAFRQACSPAAVGSAGMDL